MSHPDALRVERELTGLDYFGARYMSSAQGRFTSPDKPFADQHFENPQTWNLYSYGRNNPLRFVDDDGHASVDYLRRKANSPFSYGQTAIIDPTAAASTLDGADIRIGGENGQIYHVENGKYTKFGCTHDPKKCGVDANTLKGAQFNIVHVIMQ